MQSTDNRGVLRTSSASAQSFVPAVAVGDPHFRHHQVENLRVVDGSVFPTSLGVNPQESVMGIASWGGPDARGDEEA